MLPQVPELLVKLEFYLSYIRCLNYLWYYNFTWVAWGSWTTFDSRILFELLGVPELYLRQAMQCSCFCEFHAETWYTWGTWAGMEDTTCEYFHAIKILERSKQVTLYYLQISWSWHISVGIGELSILHWTILLYLHILFACVHFLRHKLFRCLRCDSCSHLLGSQVEVRNL